MRVDGITRPRAVRFAEDGSAWHNISEPGGTILPAPSALLEQTRRYYGRALTPATIESVIRMAEFGYMRDLTDLLQETLKVDGHFGSVVGKRHRAVARQRPNVVPCKINGKVTTDTQKFADVVREQVVRLPRWRNIVLGFEWGHFHGRAAGEKQWVRQNTGDVPWRLADINWIHPRRLCFGPRRELRVRDDQYGGPGLGLFNGQPQGVTAVNGGGFEARGLDLSSYPEKFITFLPQLFNDYPEREGYGPHCLYWSFFKRFAKREQMVLLEVFGKPWRIVFTDNPDQVQQEQLDDAADSVDEMGADATGVLPPGVKVQTDQPVQGAGQVHRDVFGDSNDEISKIALGETRTTDAKPSALGSAGDQVASDVSDEVKDADTGNIADLFSEQVAGDIIALNFGEDARALAPRIELLYQAPKDPVKETARVVTLIQVGVQLKADEVYEAIGFTQPKTEPGEDGEVDDVLVVKPPAQPATPGGFGAPGNDNANADGMGVAAARAGRVLSLALLHELGNRAPQ